MGKCAICGSEGKLEQEKFETGVFDYKNASIIIENVKVHYCTNSSCGNSWLSQSEADRIDAEVLKRKRMPLAASRHA